MKRSYFALVILLSIVFSGCIKNEEVIYKRNAVVEFDAATWNSNAAGVTYPILTRLPGYGRAVINPSGNPPTNNPDPLISRTSGTIKLRVNLVGPQRPTDTEMTYEIMPSLTTARPTVHYAPITGKYIIPANSSFGEITIQLLNPLTSSSTTRDLALQLISGPEIYASDNYKVIVLRISQQ